jgi:hypothetical protein
VIHHIALDAGIVFIRTHRSQTDVANIVTKTMHRTTGATYALTVRHAAESLGTYATTRRVVVKMNSELYLQDKVTNMSNITLYTLFSKDKGGFYANKIDGPDGGSVIVFEKKEVAEQFVEAMPDGSLYKVGIIQKGYDNANLVTMLEEALKNGIQNFCCCHSVQPDGMLSMSHSPILKILHGTDDGSHRHATPTT